MTELAKSIESLIHGADHWSYLLAYVYTTGVALVPFPAEFPAMLNGMLFGPVLGSAITWSAALIGAQASFELSRRFGRPLVTRFLRPETLRRADDVVLASGAPGLLLARFTPLIAFTAINWASGLTPLSRWTFFWTTAVGILPGAIVFTASGSGLIALYRKYPAAGVIMIALLIVLALFIQRRIRHLSTAGHEPSSETSS